MGHTNTCKDDNPEPWMQPFSPSNYEELHQLIYPYLDKIATSQNHQHHPVIKQWKSYNDMNNKYPLKPNMSWRTISIEVITQYKDFILKCPDIMNYLHIKMNTRMKNMLNVGIIPHHRDTHHGAEIKEKYLLDHSTMDSIDDIDSITQNIDTSQDHIVTVSNKCTDRTTDIQLLMATILPYIQDYIQLYPDQEYSHLCTEWLHHGLSTMSTMPDIKAICNITDLEDLYVLLMMSPALKVHMKFQWEGSCIEYTEHKPAAETLDETLPPNLNRHNQSSPTVVQNAPHYFLMLTQNYSPPRCPTNKPL